ncbi:MAG: peptidase M28, partial [Bacteroidales bacterium]|nr:peptidase M28 [Bacteroidales bacterium]
MMKRILAIAALALLGLCAPAQSSRVTDAILEEGRTNNQTMTHLDVLSNRIGGRLIGSGALEDAENWVEWQLKQWGYKVIREQVCSVPVGFNRGPWFGKIIGGSGESLHFTTPSYTAGTRGVQRGRVVIEPYTTADFERMKGTVKGAWVLISGNNTGFPTDYGQKADSLRAVDIAYNDSLR